MFGGLFVRRGKLFAVAAPTPFVRPLHGLRRTTMGRRIRPLMRVLNCGFSVGRIGGLATIQSLLGRRSRTLGGCTRGEGLGGRMLSAWWNTYWLSGGRCLDDDRQATWQPHRPENQVEVAGTGCVHDTIDQAIAINILHQAIHCDAHRL